MSLADFELFISTNHSIPSETLSLITAFRSVPQTQNTTGRDHHQQPPEHHDVFCSGCQDTREELAVASFNLTAKTWDIKPWELSFKLTPQTIDRSADSGGRNHDRVVDQCPPRKKIYEIKAIPDEAENLVPHHVISKGGRDIHPVDSHQ